MIHNESEKKKQDIFDTLIEKRWGSALEPRKIVLDQDVEPYEHEDEEPRVLPDTEEPLGSNGRALDQQP
eukprot:7797354-Ditylum_brightwellii.AAC.1